MRDWWLNLLARLMSTNSLRGLRSKQGLRLGFTVEAFYLFISFKYFPHSVSPFEVEMRALS